jgi:hypothetical protein
LIKLLYLSYALAYIIYFSLFVLPIALAQEEIKIIEETNIAANAPPGPLSESTYSRVSYVPSSICIPINTTVTWTNNDIFPHTVTDKNNQFDSSNITEGGKFSNLFENNGNFTYYDKNSGDLNGFVKVVDNQNECNGFVNDPAGIIGKIVGK